MRRRGFTLVEVLIAAAIAAVVLGVVFQLVLGAARMTRVGLAATTGPEAELVLFEALSRDLYQCLQIPGDPRPPVEVADDGRTLRFYIPDPEATDLARVVGRPVTWTLAAAPGGLFYPARNGRPLKAVQLRNWTLKLHEPLDDRPSWAVSAVAWIPSGSVLREDFAASAIVPLAQPSSNYRDFPATGADLMTGLVHLPDAAGGAPGFTRIGPPRRTR